MCTNSNDTETVPPDVQIVVNTFVGNSREHVGKFGRKTVNTWVVGVLGRNHTATAEGAETDLFVLATSNANNMGFCSLWRTGGVNSE